MKYFWRLFYAYDADHFMLVILHLGHHQRLRIDNSLCQNFDNLLIPKV